MYKVRLWSVRHSGFMHSIYNAVESVLLKMDPVWARIGYEKVDSALLGVEKFSKGLLFDSQSCGQCTLSDTGMACPMNCPKSLRNGPCGGVRGNGNCEVDPDMKCVWVTAWQGSQNMREGVQRIQIIQAPLDNRRRGTSAWLRVIREKLAISASNNNAL
ncbi:MAG: methylenetetrahydrofolate reductase C-terminal domain-containing protein [Pseudomonadales bacterium]